ncbi:3'5'-cyclic nucleotide phosphodiesterase [Nitzschia inconspicua]|uniref:3'5'-cyclic nucleotide phosphodiesterase n=1 Tax=Nitzschia inconspicua TaxID=303405 RepID=A0A9K3LJH5_9STRA|nr:3'5'-cyclic nucleotide phosphodiesterase [Nitzschia inconspicua]
MSAEVANLIRRPAWELREKLKRGRRKSESVSPSATPQNSHTRRGRRLDRSSSDGKVNEEEMYGEDNDLPPAFRTLVHSKLKDERLKRAGMRLFPRRGDGTTFIGKTRARERESRKSDILDSFAKHGLNDNDSCDRTSKPVSQKQSADRGDTISDDERSLDPSSVHKVISKSRKIGGSLNNSINNRSFGGSDRGNGSSEYFNRSLDLSSHTGFRNHHGDINTSASDDQWARFKLLGRIGLGDIHPSEAAKHMIRHNVKVISGIIKKILALRDTDDTVEPERITNVPTIKTGNLLAEVREALGVKKTRARYKRDPNSVKLKSKVLAELEDFVTVISFMYRDNPFHNFEHASTVLNNVNRVVSLCKAPDDIEYHDIRFITTDPWTHFALVFTALVHDVDHAGVPNAQLIKEGSHVATAYKNKSVAEQNSLEISWNLLMEPCYRNLREALFANSEELMHFRSLVVTATLATDIADKELAAMRKDRAAEALAVLDSKGPTSDDIASLKATFVLETLIQVADVSHLMMPFAVYKKWNYKLLRESYLAFTSGRAEKDPLETWYQGEFGFFDFYIIPLAKKLEQCGIDSSFYVNNAINNRKMWEELGEDLVKGFEKSLKSKTGSSHAYTDHSSLSEVDFDDASFGEDVLNDTESDSEDESDDGESRTSDPLPKPTETSPIVVKEKLRKVQRQQPDKHHQKLVNASKETKSPGDRRTLLSTFERLGRSVDSCISGGNARVGPGARIVYRRKGPTQEPAENERTGRTKTAIPDGQQRYKQRSKSASSEPDGAEVTSDIEHENPRSVNRRRKKKKISRSRSLENGQKKSKKGKRPGKIKIKDTE